mmetsp:Transcript_130261/g.324780  ORF Transcript_130261/g.324780 Transcript_130261/m.324780 type:complete len:221 (-) Transcript_130261:227-889(-)
MRWQGELPVFPGLPIDATVSATDQEFPRDLLARENRPRGPLPLGETCWTRGQGDAPSYVPPAKALATADNEQLVTRQRPGACDVPEDHAARCRDRKKLLRDRRCRRRDLAISCNHCAHVSMAHEETVRAGLPLDRAILSKDDELVLQNTVFAKHVRLECGSCFQKSGPPRVGYLSCPQCKTTAWAPIPDRIARPNEADLLAKAGLRANGQRDCRHFRFFR